MGRTSLLTEQQWEEIGLRLRNGETQRALAAQFGISVTTIRRYCGVQIKRSRTLSVDESGLSPVSRMPGVGVKSDPKVDRKTDNKIDRQIDTRTLAARLSSISNHLCAAAEQGAETARCLSEVATRQAHEIDAATLLDGKAMGTLKAIALLTKMANDASEIGVNLLRTNKDVPAAVQPPTPVAIHFGVKDAYQDANDQT